MVLGELWSRGSRDSVKGAWQVIWETWFLVQCLWVLDLFLILSGPRFS